VLKSLAIALACLPIALAHLSAQAINPARSTVTVRVNKAGLFSAFGHNHIISAPIQQGEVNTTARTVRLSFASAGLRVLDPEVSPKERAEVQQTMLGPQVLDAARYPQIVFQSVRAEPAGQGGWRVEGELSLHGVTRPVVLEVISTGEQYRSRVRLKQSEFGIKPISLAGGTVKVKDEVMVEFAIVLAK
jgi:polyisoprenoid-binding protein YceI